VLSAEEEVAVYERGVAETGANAVKFKIGGRMSRNLDVYPGRTEKLLRHARERLGDKAILYADANGSYTVAEGIAIGKLLENHGVVVMEEPCNFEDEDGIRRVNDALDRLTIAGGEQDTSAYRFRRLAQTGVYDVLQPDLYYNGGLVRALNVAEIARVAGKQIAPHTPKADPLIGPFWQFAALAPNLYGLQEFVIEDRATANWFSPSITARDGRMVIPATPGLGFSYDESIWPKAQKIV
jgi:L-alanine-DL-glutamate epimerase-like enolase superfamily enzyme